MIRIQLLGGFRVWVDDHPQPPLSRSDAERVWIYLLLGAEGRRERAAIAARLWPTLPPESARFNLRHALHVIRQALPPDPPGVPWLLGDRHTVVWNLQAPAQADLWQLRDRAEEAADGKDEAWAEASLALLGNLPQELLAGMDEDWLVAERLQATRWRDRVWIRLVDTLAAAGKTSQAEEAAAAWLLEDPLQEEAHRRLARLQLARGDREAALRQLERCASLLLAAIGDLPQPATQAMLDALRGPDAAGSERQPAGVRRLPRAALVDASGRLDQLASLVEGRPLVVVTGAGGSGKTRLAEELAARWIATPGRRVTWLHGEEPSMVAADQRPIGQAPTVGPVGAGISSGELWVLDAVDRHLEGAAVILSGLLSPGAPGRRVLVTCRQGLGIPGEALWPVPWLGGAGASGAATRDGGEIADFLTDLLRGLDGPPLRPSSIRSIAALLPGLPLVVGLAAWRLAAGDHGELLAQLEQGRLPQAPEPVIPERHASLAATVQWDLALLSPEGRMLLGLLRRSAGDQDLVALRRALAEQHAAAEGGSVEEGSQDDTGLGSAPISPPPVALTDLVRRGLVSPRFTAGQATRYAVVDWLGRWLPES